MRRQVVGVVGPKNFNNYDLLCTVLDVYVANRKILTLPNDSFNDIFDRYAIENVVYCETFNCNVVKKTKNTKKLLSMDFIKKTDMLIVFFDGVDKMIKNIINQAKFLEISVRIVEC